MDIKKTSKSAIENVAKCVGIHPDKKTGSVHLPPRQGRKTAKCDVTAFKMDRVSWKLVGYPAHVITNRKGGILPLLILL